LELGHEGNRKGREIEMPVNENTIEQLEKIALSHAWQAAGSMADGGGDILEVAHEVAARQCHGFDADAHAIRDATVDALSAHAHEEHGEAGDRCGITRIAGERVWWIETNAYSNWHSEQPEWWDEQVAQYDAA